MNPAAEKLLSRRLVASGLSSSQIARVKAGLRDRAFFSSRVESIRFLREARERIAAALSGARREDGATATRADAVTAIMEAARREGIATGKGGLSDPGSAARARVIVDTNAGLAAGYAQRAAQSSEGARMAFPALRLVRLEAREKPRDWRAKWNGARAELGAATGATEAVSERGPFLALKEDPVWRAISRFGVPYPPFDFGSGMGVREVDFETALEHGLVTEGYRPQGDLVGDFNAALEADLDFKGDDDEDWKWLKLQFGDQIKHVNGKLRWQTDIMQSLLDRRMADEGDKSGCLLGWLTPEAAEKAGRTADRIARRRLTITSDRLLHIMAGHGPDSDAPEGERLVRADLDLIPHVWRAPDRVVRAGGSYFFEMDVPGSGYGFRLVVEPFHNGINPVTFYKFAGKKATAP